MVRRGAKLLHAFAEASVPRVTVVTRKAYGGAYIAMNSRALGATRVFAWPTTEVAVMGAVAAVRVLHRRELAAVPEEQRPALEQELAERAPEGGRRPGPGPRARGRGRGHRPGQDPQRRRPGARPGDPGPRQPRQHPALTAAPAAGRRPRGGVRRGSAMRDAARTGGRPAAVCPAARYRSPSRSSSLRLSFSSVSTMTVISSCRVRVEAASTWSPGPSGWFSSRSRSSASLLSISSRRACGSSGSAPPAARARRVADVGGSCGRRAPVTPGRAHHRSQSAQNAPYPGRPTAIPGHPAGGRRRDQAPDGPLRDSARDYPAACSQRTGAPSPA